MQDTVNDIRARALREFCNKVQDLWHHSVAGRTPGDVYKAQLDYYVDELYRTTHITRPHRLIELSLRVGQAFVNPDIGYTTALAELDRTVDEVARST